MSTPTLRPGPETSVWPELIAQAERLAAVPVRELFERDPGRFERFTHTRAGLLLDFSRQRLDEIALGKLFAARRPRSALRERIDAMWRGEHINTTEDRAVLHVALRQPRGAGIGGAEIEKHGARPSASACSRSRRACAVVRSSAARGKPFRARGQHRHRRLGPGPRHGGAGAARLHRAARRAASSSPTSTAATWPRCWRRPIRRPRCSSSASKTFTTLETLTNARTRARLARRQARRAGGAGALRRRLGQPPGDGCVRRAPRLPLPDVGLGRGALLDVVLHRRVARHRHRREQLPGVPAWRPRDGRALPQHAVAAEPAGAHGAARRLEHQLPCTCRRSRCSPTTIRCGASRRICSSWRWRATASRSCSMASAGRPGTPRR